MDKIRDQETCLRTKSGFAQNLSADEIKKQLVDIVASKSNIAAEYIKHIISARWEGEDRLRES